MVLTYPNDDDGVLYLFSLIIGKYGFGWLDALLKQDVQWARGSTVPADTVNNNTRPLTFTTSKIPPSTGPAKARQPEAPDQFMYWAQQGAIFKSTPRPQSAMLLASFLLSDEWQQTLVPTQPSVRTSLSSPSKINVFHANNTDATGYITFVTDRANAEWWRTQMEQVIGLVSGPRPGI
jgi:hypothetical protein